MLKTPPNQISPFSSCASADDSRLSADDLFLPAGKVRARYGGVSDMSLWRWLKDAEMNFPQPIRIQNRRFWRLADLVAWETSRPSRAA